MKLIETTADLKGLMTANNAALKSIFPISGNETFTFITSRYLPNIKVDNQIAKAFIEENSKSLKKIALNRASTDLYVMI